MKAGPSGEIGGIQVVNSGSVPNNDEAADNVMNNVNSSYWRQVRVEKLAEFKL